MNIINECKFYFLNFLCYANLGKQTDCCYNVVPSSACIKSKQSGVYTALSSCTATSKSGGL